MEPKLRRVPTYLLDFCMDSFLMAKLNLVIKKQLNSRNLQFNNNLLKNIKNMKSTFLELCLNIFIIINLFLTKLPPPSQNSILFLFYDTIFFPKFHYIYPKLFFIYFNI